jgi:hypothetical protein
MTSEPRARRARTAPAYDPRARHLRVFSSALGVEKGCYIFVPPELRRDPALRVPSLYLFRGHEREWVNPSEDGSRAGRTVIDTYLDLRARDAIGPMILVFPGISSDDNHIPGLLVNCRAPELAQGRSGFGTGRFEDYLVQDLIPYIDATFPTVADGRHRGVGGFSLGGFMAFKIAAQHPQLFASASAYDGTFLYAADGGRAVRPSDGVLRNPMFGPAWGDPRDLRFIAANSPANLILRGDAAALKSITWMLQYGPQSREPWSSNFYRGEHMLRCLRRRGLQNALPIAALPDGEHTWHIADRHIGEALPIHWSALSR